MHFALDLRCFYSTGLKDLHVHVYNRQLVPLVQQPNGWSGQALVLGNFQYRDVLLVWLMVGQRTAVLAAGACGAIWIFFFRLSRIFFLSPAFWET